MNAKTFPLHGFPPQGVLACIICVTALSACSENESHIMELRLLREKLAAAEKKAAEAVEAAQQAPTPAPVADPKAGAETTARLEAASAKIASLEKELQNARSSAQTAAATSTSKRSEESFRGFVKSMEQNLQTKVGELQQSVEQALPSANIQETTVKRLRLPEEIATAFQSAVVFNITDANGQTRRLEFPVQAGLDGQWRLPGAADVQKHIAAAATQPITTPQVAAAPAPVAPSAAHTPGNVHAPSALPQPAIANISTPGGGTAPTVVIQWDTAPGRAAAQPAAAAPQPAATAATTPAAARPAPATAPRPSVPKAIMPVQQDVQIRFE